MTKAKNILFTIDGLYLQDKSNAKLSAKLIGGHSSDNLNTISNKNVMGTSSLHAKPATLKLPPNQSLYDTFNHVNQGLIIR